MTSNITENPTHAKLLHDCVSDGHLGAAMMLVAILAKSSNANVLFNIALAYYMADDLNRALDFIDLALGAMRRTAPVTQGMPDAHFNTARRLDITNGSFLKPIDETFAAQFQSIAIDNILMAGAHISNLANLTARRATYLAQLQGPNYEEFKKGLI